MVWARKSEYWFMVLWTWWPESLGIFKTAAVENWGDSLFSFLQYCWEDIFAWRPKDSTTPLEREEEWTDAIILADNLLEELHWLLSQVMSLFSELFFIGSKYSVVCHWSKLRTVLQPVYRLFTSPLPHDVPVCCIYQELPASYFQRPSTVYLNPI